LTRDTKLKALFAFLAVSSASVRGVPFLQPWGVDLHNIYVYQRCAVGQNAYLIPGKTCGDVFGRDMFYPPLLFRSFFWLRYFDIETAMRLWTALALLMLALSFAIWLRIAKRYTHSVPTWETTLFCALLSIQFPVAFLIERGGTDTVPVLLWSLASYCLCRRSLTFAGVLAGIATAYKLYPVVPTVILSVALLSSAFRSTAFKRLDFLRFGASALAAFGFCNAVFYHEARVYFGVTLPNFSDQRTPIATCMHSIVSVAGTAHTLYPKLVLLLFFALFCWSAALAISARPALTSAAVLAMSTFFAGTSWDYNLVTTYPLLLLLFIEARRTDRWLGVSLGSLAIVGERELFASGLFPSLQNPIFHLALQFAWLIGVAVELVQITQPEPSPTPALPSDAPLG
jgi:Glycosyltransferase family 87